MRLAGNQPERRNAISIGTMYLFSIIRMILMIVAIYGPKSAVSAFVVVVVTTNNDITRLTWGRREGGIQLRRRKDLHCANDIVFLQYHQIPSLMLLSSSTLSSSSSSRSSSPASITIRSSSSSCYSRIRTQSSSQLKYKIGGSNNSGTEDSDGSTTTSSGTTASQSMTTIVMAAIGIVAQPIAWISLFFVSTTGGGLPSGPFGLLGAMEGISYLAILGWALLGGGGGGGGGASTFDGPAKVPGEDEQNDATLRQQQQQQQRMLLWVTNISRLTLVVAIATLLSLIVDRGCVPNAKPILDYSAYLPICDSNAQ
jgi:hypothetical protein